jgi:CDP-diacylglycerol--glycerol-3-phosphate 3-phosphatidyltransferase
MLKDLGKIPNLITLGRLILLIPAAYFLARTEPICKLYALIVLTIAAISDFLDGYLARKLNQKTELGLILDPLSDKIMAAALVILLIVYRDFPLWLAAIILGRDIIILAGGLILKSKTGQTPASILSGKYCFAAIAVLLISYVIEYDFGIKMITPISLTLIVISLLLYLRVFVTAVRIKTVPEFSDKKIYRIIRIFATLIVSIIFLLQLLRELGWL